jgi:hypothetical protein
MGEAVGQAFGLRWEEMKPWDAEMRTMDLDPETQFRLVLKVTAVSTPPAPWRHVATLHVGGLIAVGFDDTGRYLLLCSLSGRGLYDSLAARLDARDRTQPYPIDFQRLEAEGIGPCAGARIRIAGLCGGGLSTISSSGWTLDYIGYDWPNETWLLLPPGMTKIGPGNFARCAKIGYDSELRAVGFGPDGECLVIASSDTTVLYRLSG